MAAIFESNIEENGLGGWQIRLTDTFEDRVEIVSNMTEYAQKIEEMGIIHGGNIEVKWSKNDNVTDIHFFEVREQIAKYEQTNRDKDI